MVNPKLSPWLFFSLLGVGIGTMLLIMNRMVDQGSAVAEVTLIVPKDFRGTIPIIEEGEWDGQSPIQVDATDKFAEFPVDLIPGRARVVSVRDAAGTELPIIESGSDMRRTIAYRGIFKGKVLIGNRAEQDQLTAD